MIQVIEWEDCLNNIQNKIGHHSFKTWFSPTWLYFTEEGFPCIEVPNQFYADFIEDHFYTIISEAQKEKDITTDNYFLFQQKRVGHSESNLR